MSLLSSGSTHVCLLFPWSVVLVMDLDCIALGILLVCFRSRTLNSLWLPGYLSKRHRDFGKAFELLEVDKQAILGNYAERIL